MPTSLASHFSKHFPLAKSEHQSTSKFIEQEVSETQNFAVSELTYYGEVQYYHICFILKR
jgi:hypothetical protein